MEKALGSLPLVADFCRRLGIAEWVDELCPMRDVSTSIITHGQVIELLIANRLTSPKPLVHIENWAQAWAAPEVFGTPAQALSDDRIGRALDAVAEKLDQITGSIGLAAIEEFGIDVSQMHWDMTSVSLYGSYDEVEEKFVTPKYGHPKDRRPDLKQVQAGLGVSNDGAVPVFHRAYDGGAGEVAQVVEAMKEMQKLAGPAKLLIVGDSKLVSYTNVSAMTAKKVSFIAPASKNYVDAQTLAEQRLDQAIEVDYVAARDARRLPENRGRWFVREDTMQLTGPRKRDPAVPLRRVLVYSTVRASAAQASRVKKLDRARGDLERLGRSLGSRHYPDEAAVADRIRTISRTRRVGAYR